MICDDCLIERCEKCGRPIYSGYKIPYQYPDINKFYCKEGTTCENKLGALCGKDTGDAQTAG